MYIANAIFYDAYNRNASKTTVGSNLYLRHQAFRSEQSRHGWKAINTEPHEWVLRLAPLSGGHAALSTRYKECKLMRPRKKDSSMRSATAAPDIPNQYMNVSPPTKPRICGSLKSNTRNPSVNFARPSKRPYKPNAHRKSLLRSASFWMNMCRSMD